MIIGEFSIEFDLVVMDMGVYDLISGMDWLATFRVVIDCPKRRVSIPLPNYEMLISIASLSPILHVRI